MKKFSGVLGFRQRLIREESTKLSTNVNKGKSTNLAKKLATKVNKREIDKACDKGVSMTSNYPVDMPKMACYIIWRTEETA